MRALLLIPAAAALLAQIPPDAASGLRRAREILSERDRRLPDYTCVQTVDRRHYRRLNPHHPAATCDQVRSLSPADLVLTTTDRLRLELKVSKGVEIGSWPGSRFSEQSIFKLIGGGAYGTGMLGALIADVFVNGGAAYQYLGERTSGGARLAAYAYQVPVAASHYQVKTREDWTAVPFAGEFRLDSASFALRHITEQAVRLPAETGACQVDTTVDYQKIPVGHGEFLLPRTSSIRTIMQDQTETQIDAAYTGCREYRGEATIHFGESPLAGAAAPRETDVGPLPAGLRLSVALAAPIDTDIAAAGDIIRARLRAPMVERGSKIVVPAGAAVEGRILRIEHWVPKPGRFTIDVMLEKIQVENIWRPLYAKVVASASKGIWLSPIGMPPLVARFPFVTNASRYRVPAGFRADWMTVAPPMEENK
ncbi:MAG TPA: hypothetical protein VMI94_20905 [Bryobacteraceae bacterium]|nr:hypothetical protein [Bryobacteraceae bacterium]